MNKSSIEWTNYTSNPIQAYADGRRGWFCEKVSPGCAHCYSSTMNEAGRWGGNGLAFLPANRERVEFRLNEAELLEWSKPKYRGAKVFAFDMTDLFGEWVSFDWLIRIFKAMADAPEVEFQILTKRPERMREFICGVQGNGWPLPNVWLGVTVENQRWADERIPILLDTPAAVHFISAEPLLAVVDLWQPVMKSPVFLADIDWVIVGGESGPKHRFFDPDWARGIVAMCREEGVACFVKQLGGARPGNALEDLPEDLRVREFPV